jgi:hypothetical protein
MRVDRPTMLRVLVVVIGILVGWCIYSYGMFHRLIPAASDFADAVNCGVLPGAPYHVEAIPASGQSDLLLCQVAPGRWTRTPYGNGPFFLALAIAFGSAMVALHRSTFLKWATTSAGGAATLFLLIFGIPMTLLGLQLNLVEGTLTADWALHVVLYCMPLGAVVGLVMWYTLIRRLRVRATSNNRWRGP